MIKEGRESHTLGRKVHENPNSQKFGLFCFLKLQDAALRLQAPSLSSFFSRGNMNIAQRYLCNTSEL